MDPAAPWPEYRPVYQTWRLLRPAAARPSTDGERRLNTDEVASDQTRHRIQTLRIERRQTVAGLAEAIRCDVDTVAAYERGDAVLDSNTVRRMERALGAT